MNGDRLTHLGSAVIEHLYAEGASHEEIAALFSLIVTVMIPKDKALEIFSRACDITLNAQINSEVRRITDG